MCLGITLRNKQLASTKNQSGGDLDFFHAANQKHPPPGKTHARSPRTESWSKKCTIRWHSRHSRHWSTARFPGAAHSAIGKCGLRLKPIVQSRYHLKRKT